MADSLVLRQFAPKDARAMRQLVLAGLGDHFGVIDETMNPDLDDITGVYHDAGSYVVIAEDRGEIVGCGILIAENPETGRLVRMSVRSDQRGKGLGKRLVRSLLEEARARGQQHVVCETTEDWEDAKALYRSCGFTEIGQWGGDAHFSIDLA